MRDFGDDYLALLDKQPEAPALKAMSVSVKAFRNLQNKQAETEIVSIALQQYSSVLIDHQTEAGKYFQSTLLRIPEGRQFAQQDLDKIRRSFPNLELVANEKGLLDAFVQKIQLYDPDILVSHDLYGEVMEVILQRMQKLGFTNWHRMGRMTSLGKPIPKTGNDPLDLRYAI